MKISLHFTLLIEVRWVNQRAGAIWSKRPRANEKWIFNLSQTRKIEALKMPVSRETTRVSQPYVGSNWLHWLSKKYNNFNDTYIYYCFFWTSCLLTSKDLNEKIQISCSPQSGQRFRFRKVVSTRWTFTENLDVPDNATFTNWKQNINSKTKWNQPNRITLRL